MVRTDYGEGIATKALLVAVNAKYIHTNLAVRSIAAYARERYSVAADFAEFTVNQRHADILRALYAAGADAYLFSCYIWNIECVKRLCADLRKLLPAAVIVLGGPEADWQAGALLESLPVDAVVLGEGEEPTGRLLRTLWDGAAWSGCPGIAYRGTGGVTRTAGLPPPALDDVPFAYRDLHELDGHILYYESMRGCPFRCSYCLSAGQGVRFRALDAVYSHLQAFLDAGVRQVKLVDRTFNCDPRRAVAIWRYLMENDNGTTNFHFELAGDLLDDAALALLADARPGLFQFEIGVQSTHPPTLAAVRRVCDFAALRRVIGTLHRGRNIHLHLDLIAGLPHEDFARFARSFDEVFALAPHQLQLGFLKLLGGSQLRRDAGALGIVFQDTAPYEVLRTARLAYGELVLLHGVEEMVDRYYNSGRFRHLLDEVMPRFPSPFRFFLALWEFYDRRQRGAPLSKTGYYDLLGDFLAAGGIALTERLQWLCLYDLLLHEKPRGRPGWVKVDRFWENRSLLREARRLAGAGRHIEIFAFAPPDGAPGETVLIFDYTRRDITGRAGVRAVEKQVFAADPSAYIR